MKTEDRIYIAPPRVPKYRWPPDAEPVAEWKTWTLLGLLIAVGVGVFIWLARSIH